MTFRNEVMDFVATYKAMSPTSQDRYYDILREEAQRKRKKDDAVEKARQDAYKRAKQGYPTPQSNVPTVASTNTPGMSYPTTGAPTAASAPDTAWSHGNPGAIDTNWPEFAPAMRRGGSVQRYQRGGSVKRYADGGDVTNPGMSEDELNRSEADRIVEQFLGRDEATTAKLRAAGDREPIDDIAARDTFAVQGEMMRQDEAARTAGAQQRDTASFTQQPSKDTSKSPVRRFAEGTLKAIRDPFAAGDEEKRSRLLQERWQNTPNPFTPKTDAEIANLKAERDRIDAELASDEAAIAQRDQAVQLGVPSIPGFNAPFTQSQREAAAAAQPPGNGPAAARGPDMGPAIAAAGGDTALVPRAPSGVYGPVTSGAITGPGAVGSTRGETGGQPDVGPPKSPYPSQPGRPQPGKPQQQAGGGTGAGPSGGTTGPGSGNGSVAPPPLAAGAVRTEDPRTRTAAFDPGRERINPNQTTAARQFDQQGNVIMPTPQELQQMVATAAQGRGGNGAPAIGDGAVSRQNVQQMVGQYNQGGALSEGQALMAGMHAAYRELLNQGRSKEAAEMAWGIIQAANLEAASLGMVARDQVRNGDIAGARTSLAKALDWAPDGTRHKATPYGIDSYDMNGNLVSRSVIDGKKALALSLGLSDGSAVWQALEQTVASLRTPDKDAEGRALRNDLTRMRMADLQQRMRNRGRGGTGESEEARRLRTYLATGQLPTAPAVTSEDTNG